MPQVIDRVRCIFTPLHRDPKNKKPGDFKPNTKTAIDNITVARH
jgi:hypothetical protein